MSVDSPHPKVADVLALASGFSALVYEVLWLRQLGLLFGNTAEAAATGFGIFFAGLALGASAFGRTSARLRRPLRTYAWIELAIAAAGSLYFWLPDLYRGLHAPLFELVRGADWPFLLAKACLAAIVLVPPAFFMGGTMPVLAHAALGEVDHYGRAGARLYGLNTAGAAAGALAAGFVLPPLVGFRGTCLVAIAINVVVALGAVLAGRGSSGRIGLAAPVAGARNAGRVSPGARAVAAASGWAILGVEVAASRLFAQVFQNSVYTFAIVLTTFLLTLAAGSFLASRIVVRRVQPWPALGVVALTAALMIAVVPFVFVLATAGLEPAAPREGWAGYVAAAFGLTFVTLAPPCTAAGIVFPFLFRITEGSRVQVGPALGVLGAWNTIGAIAGSVTTGFVLLPLAGLWLTFTLLAAIYLLIAAYALWYHARGWLRLAPALSAAAVSTIFVPTGLPLIRVNEAAGERAVEIRESHHGVTAVVERPGERLIKLNNYYALGGTGSIDEEENQARVPLLMHPVARSIFFLGLGTGITAGAAVAPGVDRIVVAELIPDVARAAREHFHPFTNGLFDDPRVHVVVNDGRSHLSATRETHDLIVGDLFVPWQAGAGSLYTREHFATVRQRLTPAGIFVQWLPLYQLSKAEFMTIARTMLAVFADVVLWRGDFSADAPFVALAGADRLVPLDAAAMLERARALDGLDLGADEARALTLPYYAGHLSMATGVVPSGPLNLDDTPVIEYGAPISQRRQRSGEIGWFTGADLLAFFRQVQSAVPPDRDPYLARLSAQDRSWIHGGGEAYAAAVYRAAGDIGRADEAAREARRLMAPD